MPSMTKTECISHIHALTNEVKTVWETTPDVTAEKQTSRFTLIEAHTQTELNILNLLPETTEWVDYRMCLLCFITFGSAENEIFLIIPVNAFATHDEKDVAINEYAITHTLLTDAEKEIFLNRNHSNEWNKYLKLHPGMTEERYYQLMESRQNSQITTHSRDNTTAAFFSPVNNKDDGETAEPAAQYSRR